MSGAQENTRLLIMARQIADFFRAYPEDEAVAAIADHINHFWTRRMRDDFLAFARARPDEVDPLVVRSLPSIRTGEHSSAI